MARERTSTRAYPKADESTSLVNIKTLQNLERASDALPEAAITDSSDGCIFYSCGHICPCSDPYSARGERSAERLIMIIVKMYEAKYVTTTIGTTRAHGTIKRMAANRVITVY